MKCKKQSCFALVLAMVAGLFTAAVTHAQTWNVAKTGIQSWDVDGNWITTPFPNAVGATADLRVNIGAALTLNLNQGITVGTLYIGDSGSSGFFTTTIAAGTAGSLIMDQTGTANALISKTNGNNDKVDTISANIDLVDNLVVNNSRNHVNGMLKLTGIISGVGRSLEVTGGGTASYVQLSNANTYNGTTMITSGILQLGSGATGGNGSVGGNIVNNANGTLSINNYNAQALSGANYSGTGSFKKIGAGTLTLNGEWILGGGASSEFHVGTTGPASSTTVDATASTGFTFSGLNFFVGAGPSGVDAMTGTLKLGPLNTITANQITIGGLEPDSNGNNGHAGLVTTLADSVTTINAANMALGTGKGGGTQISGQTGGKFQLGNGATLNLYGLTGSNSRAALVLGRFNVGSAARGQGTMDLSAGTANLILSELRLGCVLEANGLGSSTTAGIMTLGSSASNHLDISGSGSVVKIGYYNFTTTGSSATSINGTLTIGNLDATSSITSTDNSTAILIGYENLDSLHTIIGTLNVNGGTLKITTTGAAIASGGAMSAGVSSRLYLDGGVTLVAGANSADWIHSLKTAEIKSGGVTINTDDKTIAISQAFSGAGGLTKTGAGTLALTGNNSFAGSILIEAGILEGLYGSTGGGSLTNQATLSPGGTATANFAHTGNVVLESGSTLRMDVGGATSDTLSVAGEVKLDGALTMVEGVTLTETSYTLLTGTSVTGTFSAINGLPANASIVYTATSVVMNYVPQILPETPTGLTATAGDKQVALSWSSSAYAAGYNVWRSTTEGGTYTAVVSNHPDTNYTDTGLVNLTTYYYKVSATNGAGESALSGPMSAMPTSDKNILTFNFPGLPAPTIGINTVTLDLALWTNVTALAPTFTLSPGASCSPASGAPVNFSTPQTYTVTGEDMTTKEYAVTITMPPPATGKDILSFVVPGATNVVIDTSAATVTVYGPFWLKLTPLSPTYTLSQYATCVPVSNPSPGLDFSSPRLYTVTAQDGSTKPYIVTVEASASPGPITPVYTKPGDGTIVATFTNGVGTWTIPGHVTNVQVLVVGGGGSGEAGSGNSRDGGGAGGLAYYTNYTVTAGSDVPVVVGLGGAGRTSYGIGNNGKTSVFAALTAAGGEGGGNGGRGGNSGGLNLNGTITSGGLGGTYLEGTAANGGGGAGQNGGGNWDYCPGGNGYQVDITGTLTYYAGGGGGNAGTPTGGLGGGGRGNFTGGVGEPGVNGLGGGGGASRDSPNSGAGGSGVVILRYPQPPPGTMVMFF